MFKSLFGKKVCVIIFIFITCFLFSYAQTVDAASQKIVGVLQFNNSSGRNNLNSIVTDSIVSELSNNPKLKVIDRIHMDSLINEQGLGHTGLIDPSTAAQFGRIIGLNYIIIGTVTDARISDNDRILWNQSKAEVVVSAEVIDSNTGAVIFADTVTGSVEKIRTTDEHGRTIFGDRASYNEYGGAAQNAAQLFCNHFTNKISAPSFTAYVADLDSDRVYLDIRSNKSVVPGQIFIIFREGKRIKSPITGELLGIHKQELCQITIDYVDDRVASGTITNGDASEVQIGDKAMRQ